MKPRVVYHTNDLEFPITLEQISKLRYRVTYGKQVKSGLSYIEAAEELGLCIMHALQTAGQLEE